VAVDGIYDRTQMSDVYRQWQSVPSNHWKIPALHEIIVRAGLVGKNSTPYTPTGVHDFMHNKVLVIDDTVITGSYNFSRSAEFNAENILFIESAPLADIYSAYIDDLKFENLARAVFLRAPHAHALIRSIDTTAAKAAPGVLAVLTAADAAADGLKSLRPYAEANVQTGERFIFDEQPLLAADKVRFTGETVAMVVAETLTQALDASGCESLSVLQHRVLRDSATCAEVLGYPTLALVAAMTRGDTPGPVTVCMSGGHGEWFVQDFAANGLPASELASLPAALAAEAACAELVAGNQAEALVALRGRGRAMDLRSDARAWPSPATATAPCWRNCAATPRLKASSSSRRAWLARSCVRR